MNAPTDELLRVSGMNKTFGGASALSDVSFSVASGEIHGLLGENGSGKSTLIKILAGFHAPDSGQLSVRGQSVRLPLGPGQFRALGLEFVHQDLGLIPSISVVENLRLGELAARRGMTPIRWGAERARAKRTFDRYGVDIDVSANISELSSVQQALVAIIRGVENMNEALESAGHRHGVLFLDEPTAFLPRDQVDILFSLMRRIADTGSSVVFVSHDLDEVRRITDRATVLRSGFNAGTVRTPDVTVDDLVQMIIGHALGETTTQSAVDRASVVAIRLSGLCSDAVDQVDLELRQGEIVGLTGLVGSGFESVPYQLFGAEPVRSGTITLFGETREVSSLSPKWGIENGIALIPGNRQRDGSIGSLSAAENMMALSLDDYFRHGRLRVAEMRREAAKLMDQYDIRPREPGLPFSSFSGGNQQKAMLAKWLSRKPRVLLLHEPTQGVDVGARLTIINLIREAAAQGMAVVCASSDYEQLAMLCHRVLVVGRGRVTDEITGAKVTKEYITERSLRSVDVRAVDSVRKTPINGSIDVQLSSEVRA